MKVKKSVWLPSIIFIYFLAMAIIFGKEMIAAGETLKFMMICGTELVIIILLVIFLRKKEKITKD